MIDFLRGSGLEAVVEKKLGMKLDVIVHKSLDSTNSWSLRESKAGQVLPFACFAEQQTSGRGRRGKCWHMSANNNIAMSLAWPFMLSTQSLNLLPLSIALAIVEVLESLGLKQVQIKWPNDVYVQGKKIAGVLIETQAVKRTQVSDCDAAEYTAVVIGVGLNYQMHKAGQVMMDQADDNEVLVLTDICQQLVRQKLAQQKLARQKIAEKATRNGVASALLCGVINVCRNFSEESRGNLAKFRNSYDFCKQKKVKLILDDKEVLTGIAQGVSEQAELLVLIAGELRAFNSAEVSVQAD